MTEVGSSCEQVLISPFLHSTLWVIFILCVFSLSLLFSEHWSSSMDGAAYLQRCLEALPQGCLWIITNHSTNTAWLLVQTSWQWANRQTERQQVRDDIKKKKNLGEVSHSGSTFQTENKNQRFEGSKETLENHRRGDGMWFCCIYFDCALDSRELLPLSVRLSMVKEWIAANAVQRSESSSKKNPQANGHRQRRWSE